MLLSKGYVEERVENGRSMKVRTEQGILKGIAEEEKTGKMGTVYTVLRYPADIQKEIVEHYIEIGREMSSKG